MTPMLTEVVPQPRAWRGPSLRRDEYVVPIPDECRIELRRVLEELRAAPVPTLLLLPEHFDLSACARWMANSKLRYSR